MKNEKKPLVFTYGEYAITEAKTNDNFYFFRTDGEKLGEVGEKAVEMLQEYLVIKKIREEIPYYIPLDVKEELVGEGRCLKLTAQLLKIENLHTVSKELILKNRIQ